MYSINWKQLVRVVLGLILLISLLAVLSDIYFFSIQSAISVYVPNRPSWEADDSYAIWPLKVKQKCSQDEILKHWKELWMEGGSPQQRTVNITINQSIMTVDYSFEISRDHPASDFVLSSPWEVHPKLFVECVFGSIFLDYSELSDKDFQSPQMIFNTAHGTLSAHFSANKEIDEDQSIFLFRNLPGAIKLVPGVDKVIVNYKNRNLVSIDPYPTLTYDSTVTYEEKSPNTVERVRIRTRNPIEALAEKAGGISAFSRQMFLLKLGRIFDRVPFLTTLLGAILSALPLLLFLRVLSTQKAKKSPTLLLLGDVVILLLTFHFVYFLVIGTANLFLTLANRTGLVASLNMQLASFLSSFGVQGYSGYNLFGFFMVQMVVVGVLLPTVILRRSKEWNTFREGKFFWSEEILLKNRKFQPSGRRFSWWLSFTIFILFLIMVVPLLIEARAGILFQLPDDSSVHIILYCLMIIGVTGLIGLAILNGIYRLIDGKPKSLSIISLAFWGLFVGNLILGISFVAMSRFTLGNQNPYSGWGWFFYSTILGAILVYSFMYLLYTIFTQAGWMENLLKIEKRMSIFSQEKPANKDDSVGMDSQITIKPLVKPTMILTSIILAIPMRLLFSNETTSAYYYEVMRLADQLDQLIGPIFLVGLIWYFYEQGSRKMAGGPIIKKLTLSIGQIGALLILYPSTANWLFIPFTFLLGYLFLLYYIQDENAWGELAPLYKRVFEERNVFLEEIVKLNTGERSYQSLHKTLSKKMNDGEKTYGDFNKEVDEMRNDLDLSNKKAMLAGKPLKDVALAFGPFETAWRNGTHGAFWATIFAIPWMLIWLSNFMKGEAVLSPYPLWAFFNDLLNLIINWVGIGFLFGYFYPYLRGRNGLQKGLLLWVVAVLPAIPLALIHNNSVVAWQGFIFWILQMFIHCMLLGLIAFDYMTLRQGYRDWQMLFEIHGIPSVGLSISTILLAIGTAATALFQKQTQDLIAAALTFIIPNMDKFINPP